MSTSNKRPNRSRQARPRRDGRIVIRGVERDRPDLRKLSRAVIAMAQAEAEREAQIQYEQKSVRRTTEDLNDE
ncbi:hypothetical protein AYX22_17815 [Arthrobacter sp. D5-1]|nr:hypothetical protein AYX22_17815 [Arthrobacter sp. D5-1]